MKTWIRKYWKFLLPAGGLLIALMWIFGDPPVYFAREIRGTVVDEATRKPLAGAIVVAEWIPGARGIGHSQRGPSIKTTEVVTDRDGNYVLPAWGPRLRLPFTFFNGGDPELSIFLPDYLPALLSNALLSYENRDTRMVRESHWNGKTIGLQRFDGKDWQDYSFKLRVMRSPEAGCLRECPRLVLALDAESRRISQAAPKEPFIPNIVDLANMERSDREYLENFKAKR